MYTKRSFPNLNSIKSLYNIARKFHYNRDTTMRNCFLEHKDGVGLFLSRMTFCVPNLHRKAISAR